MRPPLPLTKPEGAPQPLCAALHQGRYRLGLPVGGEGAGSLAACTLPQAAELTWIQPRPQMNPIMNPSRHDHPTPRPRAGMNGS